jgi:GT2 family glycosyltransferase
MRPPRFGILILNMNGARWLPALYKDLSADGYDNKRIYLVDNGSTDGSQAMTRERYPEVTLLQMPRNMGYCMAYNAAVEAAFADGCDWVIWQNNDTRVLPGWLDRMAAAAASDARIGVMGPVFRDWSSDQPNFFMEKRHPDVIPFMENSSHAPVDADWVEGSALAVKRECLDTVGPLEPSLFIYWEETDFCRRARYQGWRVVLVPGSVARHFGGGDTASGVIPAVNFNALKTRNYYVYEFCDPEISLGRGLVRAIYLFLVNVKAGFRSQKPLASLWQNTKVFAWFLSGLPAWWAKRARDRRREKPPRFSSGHDVSLKDLFVKDNTCQQPV